MDMIRAAAERGAEAWIFGRLEAIARKTALLQLPSIVDFVTSFVMEGKKTADTATSLDGHILSIL